MRDFVTLCNCAVVTSSRQHEKLQESLAKDFGVQPVGPAYTFSDEDVDHIGKPRSEIVEKFADN